MNRIKYSKLVEGAFVFVIGQNAFLMSKPIVSFMANKIGVIELIIFIAIGIINTLNIIANWMSSNKTEDYYTSALFFWDIITLAIFCVFTQVISCSFDNDTLLVGIDKVIFVFSILYVLIYLTFAIWNFTNYKCTPNNKQERQLMSTAILGNILTICALIVACIICLTGSYFKQVVTFFIEFIILMIVLVYYFFATLFLSKSLNGAKVKALWIGGKRVYFVQTVVSLFSYLRYPFMSTKKDAIKIFFTNMYNNHIKDPLVFDGNNFEYFNKLEVISESLELKDKTVIDFCCGQGSLYFWLKKKNINFSEYIGVDFSHENKQLDIGARIFNSNILNYKIEKPNDTVLFICNGLCYLNQSEFDTMINNIKDVSTIVIIEPVPGFFWDACFNHIKVHYRGKRTLAKKMKKEGYELLDFSTDYAIKIGELYFHKLSRAYIFQKHNNI